MDSRQRLEELVEEGTKLYSYGHFGAVVENSLYTNGQAYTGRVVTRFDDGGKETVYGPIAAYHSREGAPQYRELEKILRASGKNVADVIVVDVRVIETPSGQSYQFLIPTLLGEERVA